MDASARAWLEEQIAKYKKVDGVDYDLNARWENGVKHHPKSTAIFKRIAELDFLFSADFFCWKSGGDGDNGEFLMYLLDVIFEEDDKIEAKKFLEQIIKEEV